MKFFTVQFYVMELHLDCEQLHRPASLTASELACKFAASCEQAVSC